MSAVAFGPAWVHSVVSRDAFSPSKYLVGGSGALRTERALVGNRTFADNDMRRHGMDNEPAQANLSAFRCSFGWPHRSARFPADAQERVVVFHILRLPRLPGLHALMGHARHSTSARSRECAPRGFPLSQHLLHVVFRTRTVGEVD